MTMGFYDPRDYIDPAARIASGDTPPPLEGKIGLVTLSPGDLFLAAKGLTSGTKALVTKLSSATEIVTSRNEAIIVRNQQTGTGIIAIDTGASVDPQVRNLLVVSETVEEPLEAPELSTDPTYVTQEEDTSTASSTTIENANPSDPSQYIVTESETKATSKSLPSAPSSGTTSVLGQRMSSTTARLLGVG